MNRDEWDFDLCLAHVMYFMAYAYTLKFSPDLIIQVSKIGVVLVTNYGADRVKAQEIFLSLGDMNETITFILRLSVLLVP